MAKFDEKHYVSILKGKIGEFRSLRETRGNKNFTPMIDVAPIAWDFANEAPKKAIDGHLLKLPSQIAKYWGAGREIFFDFYMLEQEERMSDGRHPLVFVFDRMHQESESAGFLPDEIRAIPVTGIGRCVSYQTAVAEVIQRDRRGFCLRLQNTDFGEDVDLEKEIQELLQSLQTPVSEADLVIDLKEVTEGAVQLLTLAIRGMIGRLPFLNKWRTFTLAGGAMPQNLTSVSSTGEPHILPRAEWTLWRTLVSSRSKPSRLPAYGDYGIRHPHFTEAEVDPKQLPSAPNLRYTHAENWVALKAKNAKKHKLGLEQFRDLCRTMIGRREFCGRDFSWGDETIYACATEGGSCGNATTWVTIGTSHHIDYVLLQIANFFGS